MNCTGENCYNFHSQNAFKLRSLVSESVPGHFQSAQVFSCSGFPAHQPFLRDFPVTLLLQMRLLLCPPFPQVREQSANGDQRLHLPSETKTTNTLWERCENYNKAKAERKLFSFKWNGSLYVLTTFSSSYCWTREDDAVRELIPLIRALFLRKGWSLRTSQVAQLTGAYFWFQ